MRYLILWFALQFLSGCWSDSNYCNCKEKELTGFFVCDRRATTNNEYLWLFKDSTYIHLLQYDTIQFINSNKWHLVSIHNRDFIEVNSWICPCKIDRSDCYNGMDTVTDLNYKNNYAVAVNQFDYGCYKGLDNK